MGSTVLVPVAFLDTGALETSVGLDPGGLLALALLDQSPVTSLCSPLLLFGAPSSPS